MIDLGKPDALRYIEQFISAAVEKYELDVWRVDFNTNPAVVWARTGDAHTAPTNAAATGASWSAWAAFLQSTAVQTIAACAPQIQHDTARHSAAQANTTQHGTSQWPTQLQIQEADSRNTIATPVQHTCDTTRHGAAQHQDTTKT